MSDGLSCPETVRRTYQISDNIGNSNTCEQLILIQPSTAPAEVGGPVATSSTVDCAVDTVIPTLPVIEDVCGNVLVPGVPVMSGSYVGCEGTVIYTYTYADCAGNDHDWSYTYTIDIPDFTVPANGGSTVDCLADAQVQPATPAVNDFCGDPITPTLVTTPADIACEGTGMGV